MRFFGRRGRSSEGGGAQAADERGAGSISAAVRFSPWAVRRPWDEFEVLLAIELGELRRVIVNQRRKVLAAEVRWDDTPEEEGV